MVVFVQQKVPLTVKGIKEACQKHESHHSVKKHLAGGCGAQRVQGKSLADYVGLTYLSWNNPESCLCQL